MGLINVPQIQTLDAATESLFNSRFGTIVDVINGNLSSENLADGAVSTPKLANKAVTAAKLDDGTITATQLATGSTVMSAVTTTAAEVGFTGGVPTLVPGMSTSVTTTKANQMLVVISRVNAYQGGVTRFEYLLDGVAAGNSSQYNTGVNTATTGFVVYIDFFTVPTPGAHTIALRANAGSTGLRFIHAEGPGKLIVMTG